MKPEVTLNQALDAFDPTTADPQGRATRARSILERMEALVTSGELHRTEAGVLARYLDSTRRSSFLVALGGPEERRRWAETTFEAIRASRYTLETMLDQRVAAHPDRVMFGEAQNTGGTWTYAQVRRRIRLIAASFLGDVTGDPHPAPRRPRVAILADNSVDAACCDLACLVHDIFVAPISVHFDAVTVAALFDKLEIDRAVCDSELLYLRLLEVRKLGRARFRIYNLGEATHLAEDGDIPLAMGFSHLGQETVDELIRNRPRFSLDDDATVLFTSGSTGLPKGVVFSQFNLVSKRFARAAALPRVGDDEVFLCYLPLFHTFGRYLELLGTLFWGGTYAFAGNPSAETLIALLERVRPTALISIPLRWVQIREECLRRMDATTHPEERRRVFSETVGGRLSWGLSAAGHLDARVFHFFNDHGVRLCSGFGMTEATGGITMTPPGQYQDDSVGVPLPGVKIRLSDEGELHISGPYVARYLDDPRPAPGEEHWLATGDVFVLGEGGHLQIVDKIKDLYKNTKGQTIAPRRVEQKYADVPGIKRVFLVGDGRDHNVLLIVPDRDDEVLKKAATTGMVDGYFRQIVRAANRDLAAYERVVNFALLDRDLSLQRDELTPKGSYRRKAIEEHFQEIIGDLYRQKHVDVTVDSLTVRIPRWLIRDLGILENDIVADGSTLVNLQNRRSLTVRRGEASGRVRVGDLEYEIRTGTVDLGTFSRQPMLWAGNPSLVAFCACKDGWDLSLGEISPQIFLVRGGDPGDQPAPAPLEHLPNDPRLRCLHDVSVSIFFGPVGEATRGAEELGRQLARSDERTAALIRRRLEALARHPDLKLRTKAYRILLLDRPSADYSKLLPTFIAARLPFLDEESIEEISRANLERRRLEALRKRLHDYRVELRWPASEETRRVFENILRMLVNFVRYHPEFYGTVRDELVAWILHDSDRSLSKTAEKLLFELAGSFEATLVPTRFNPDSWEGKVVFQEGLSTAEVARLERILVGTTLLAQAVALTHDTETFDIDRVGKDGVWVSRTSSLHRHSSYRVSINTEPGKHFDLQLVVPEDIGKRRVLSSIYWTIGLHSHPFIRPAVAHLGCWRPELGAIVLEHVSDLNTWERIREFASIRPAGVEFPTRDDWRKLFVKAMSTFFLGWLASERRIVPGAVDPSNVMVPEPDFREGALILSLNDFGPYKGPLSLVGPLIRNFYVQTFCHFPWSRRWLDHAWIFDACCEALGSLEGREFLEQLRREIGDTPLPGQPGTWADAIESYLDRLGRSYHVPIALHCAVERFQRWKEVNPHATADACDQIIGELYRLYELHRFPELMRYHLYRHTYFAEADRATDLAFDRLLARMARQPGHKASSMVELSDLQATLSRPEDQAAFGRLVFPRSQPSQRIELMAVGEGAGRQVIVLSHIKDGQGLTYSVREPIDAAEVGKLYRLYFTAGFVKTISGDDRFLVVLDDRNEVVSGLCWRPKEPSVAHLDGIVVAPALRGRGLNSALLIDFCSRLTAQGLRVVTTHFFIRRFYMRHGFRIDRRWGGLVRFLSEEQNAAPVPVDEFEVEEAFGD